MQERPNIYLMLVVGFLFFFLFTLDILSGVYLRDCMDSWRIAKLMVLGRLMK